MKAAIQYSDHWIVTQPTHYMSYGQTLRTHYLPVRPHIGYGIASNLGYAAGMFSGYDHFRGGSTRFGGLKYDLVPDQIPTQGMASPGVPVHITAWEITQDEWHFDVQLDAEHKLGSEIPGFGFFYDSLWIPTIEPDWREIRVGWSDGNDHWWWEPQEWTPIYLDSFDYIPNHQP